MASDGWPAWAAAMSGKSKRNRSDKSRSKPSGWGVRDRSRLLTPLSRQALASNLNLIVRNRDQFIGPAMASLSSMLVGLATVTNKNGDLDVVANNLANNDVIALWDLVYDVLQENRATYMRLTPPGSHDDCALDLQNGLNAFAGLPDEMEWMAPMLGRGGAVVMPCPACTEDGQPHFLTMRKVGDEFVVEADDE
jgi:hypothetical protein